MNPARISTPSEDSAESSRVRTILLVDDESTITDLIGSRLRLAGYQVVCVANGAEALDWLELNRADLIVSDLHMPFVGGIDLCRTLASDSTTAGIPILLLTADAVGLDVDGLLNLRGVIHKPFSAAEIVTRSVEVLGVKKSGEPEDSSLSPG